MATGQNRVAAQPAWDIFITYVTSEDSASKLTSTPASWSDATQTFPEILKEHLLRLDPALRCFIDKAPPPAPSARVRPRAVWWHTAHEHPT